MKRLVLLTLVGLILLGVTPAGADDAIYVIGGGGGVGTKITSLPYTISAPGFYYLDRNLKATSGNGILINSDNGSVTLDLMGFSLSGTAGNKGIYSMSAQSNIEVRNGTLTAWEWAIDLPTGTETIGIRVINVRVFGCNSGGIRVGGASAGSLVKGCTVSNCIVDCGIQNNKGAIIGNTVTNCPTGIRINSGSIVGNNILCNTGQTGISLSGDLAANFILIDQNTVNGEGTHLSGVGANTVKYGHNAFNSSP
jgi:hypothetical protein